ncbi:MAG: hypothetical protein GIW95_08780 [Candidatus Eremiobacteraeota bacterium]|nr:hypothetical protein [Candidatus Eremiobacteraeota bacterium]
MGALQAVAVSVPTNAVERAIPIQGEPSAIAERAVEQHGIFKKRLAAHGVKVANVEAALGTFSSACADLAVIFPDGAFVMRPSDLARRSEIAALERALATAGIPVVQRIEAPGLLDGGDVMLAGDSFFVGVPAKRASDVGIIAVAHGNAHGREQIAAYARSIGLNVVEIPFSAMARRLTSIAAAVDDGVVVCAPGLLDASAFAPWRRIEVPLGEDYGAGVLALGGRHVIANVRFREVLPLLRVNKIRVDAIDLGEFGKIGLTPSSLALVLKRA